MSIRYWAALVTALATAALVDFAASDGHQEAVLPVAVLAALVAIGLGLTVALRAGRGEQIRYREMSAGRRFLMAAAGVAAVFTIITLMEAYEMRFGGLSALDPQSVFVEHWPAVLIGYVAVATTVGALVNAILCAAVAAGRLAAHVLVAFMRVDRRARAAMPRRGDSFGTRILHRPIVLERGALALRAPPPLQLLDLQQLLT